MTVETVVFDSALEAAFAVKVCILQHRGADVRFRLRRQQLVFVLLGSLGLEVLFGGAGEGGVFVFL